MCKTIKCSQCELMMVNGIIVHEIGCPLAWRDEIRDCKWCGQEFRPEHDEQVCCDATCLAAWLGL